MKSTRLISSIFFSCILINGCTKLHETEGSYLTSAQIAGDTSSSTLLLTNVYTSLEFTFTSYLEVFALSELTTDEAIAPTRANNWDDNGSWRVLHQQTWDPNNSHIHDCFKSLGGVIFAATDMLQQQYKATIQQQAEARFLRAFAMYWLLDLFDQVPYRDPGENLILPSRVRKGIVALDYIISEINAAEADLPPDAPADRANKDAAKVLLMKCYLNKAVYANRSNFSTADPTDMNMVISLADSVIQSGKYNFSNRYFDNFAPDNITHKNENIFTQSSSSDGNYYIGYTWAVVLHNSQGGFNGFTTLSDFYNKFEPNDKRRGFAYSYPNSAPNPRMRTNVGFLIGQQYDLYSDDSLFDQEHIFPLIYTAEVHNIVNGPTRDFAGIRPLKYPPDMPNYFGTASNEFVYFRFPDVLLMKAEAILRGGTGTNVGGYGDDATKIVNAIRADTSRNASLMPNVTLGSLYDERGRELWWEDWRRQDMIRFKKFLGAFQEKEYESNPRYLLFPIPYDQLALDSNYKQNPGY